MDTRETKSPRHFFLGRQRRRLLEQLEEVGKTLEREEIYLRTMGTLHPSDIADQAEEECEDQEVAETLPSLRARYEGIVEALRRLEENSYGKCADCGCVIPKRRLQFMPSAVRCLACEESLEILVGSAAR
jgi:RNA polymerase-binding transcription factor DksA